MVDRSAVIVSSVSLSGGQGKTSVVYGVGLKAAQLGLDTLVIDGDPQWNLTRLLNVDIEPNYPSLKEVLTESYVHDERSRRRVSIEDAIYPVPDKNHLFLVPADRALDQAQVYLSNHPNSSVVLRKRLEPIMGDFDLIFIDTPPQNSGICRTSIGAAHAIVLPVEAVPWKGGGTLVETWDLIKSCRENEAFHGKILGVLPFRVKMVGLNFTKESYAAIEQIDIFLEEEGFKGLRLPSLLESEIYKKALGQIILPAEIDPCKADLEKPLIEILNRLRKFSVSISQVLDVEVEVNV